MSVVLHFVCDLKTFPKQHDCLTTTKTRHGYLHFLTNLYNKFEVSFFNINLINYKLLSARNDSDSK